MLFIGLADKRVIRVVARKDRGRFLLGRDETRFLRIVDPVRETGSIPELGGIGLKDAPVLGRVRRIALGPGHLGVDVVVQRASVGDDVELRAGRQMVTGEDGVWLLNAGRALKCGRDLVASRVFIVDFHVGDLASQQTTTGVDLVDGHAYPVGHLLAV